MYKFNVEEHTLQLTKWISNYFRDSNGKIAVIGISGGKDSSIIASLCVKALGREHIYGVLMPDGEQSDIDDAINICQYLGIQHSIINIKETLDEHYKSLGFFNRKHVPYILKTNCPARIRMMTLYSFSGSISGGRVINTCNLSEEYIGWFTKFGDGAGDCFPCQEITATEMIQIGLYLNLPEKFVLKTPDDGMCGESDEEKFGFTYEQLDSYIRTGKCDDLEVMKRIKTLHRNSQHKHNIPYYKSSLGIYVSQTD